MTSKTGKTLQTPDPLKLTYKTVINRTGQVEGRLTELKIISQGLGVLTPEQYRVATNRDGQCEQLAFWALQRVLGRFTVSWLARNDFWISCYMPVRCLLNEKLQKKLASAQKEGYNFTGRLVLELSAEAMYADDKQLNEAMQQLNADYGVRFILSQYGDEFCPFLRQDKLNVNYVLTDTTVSQGSLISDPQLILLMQRLQAQGRKIILNGDNGKELLTAEGCIPFDFYLGPERTFIARRREE